MAKHIRAVWIVCGASNIVVLIRMEDQNYHKPCIDDCEIGDTNQKICTKSGSYRYYKLRLYFEDTIKSNHCNYLLVDIKVTVLR
jgi:hypothetical protein